MPHFQRSLKVIRLPSTASGITGKMLETHWSARGYAKKENDPLAIRQKPKKKTSWSRSCKGIMNVEKIEKAENK
jgi:hypothetical protein